MEQQGAQHTATSPHIIAVSNQKGGVGKTTTAVNLAACLGALGYPTLLVDLDPQANATSACGVDTHNLEVSIYDALVDGAKPVPYPLEAFENLCLLPSSMDLAGADLELMDRPHREAALQRALTSLDAPFAFIIVDAPPSLGLLTINALVAAHWVLLPVQAEYLALEGLSHMTQTIQRVRARWNPALQLMGILVTMFDVRTNLAHQVMAELRRAFPGKVFQTAISRSVRLSEAPSHGKPIIYYDPRSLGADHYRQLCQEVLHVCQKERVGSGA